MLNGYQKLWWIPIFIIVSVGLNGWLPVVAQQTQNPSPMREKVRQHARIPDTTYSEKSIILSGVLSEPVTIFLPELQQSKTDKVSLLFHFHGAGYVVDAAVVQQRIPIAGICINLGAGSGIYTREFNARGSFQALYDTILTTLKEQVGKPVEIDKVILSGFSAGYGAVRSILAQDERPTIDGVLLLDGIHTGYNPPGTGLYYGGKVDSTDVMAFVNYAGESAVDNSPHSFLITHSEIFPGAYVSTTEATDYILQKLAVDREPVLEWGPGGMQQLSIAEKGRFIVMGFAGNTAPDHMDHLHNLPVFLAKLLEK